jgi:CheY-like chemotaxis protein
VSNPSLDDVRILLVDDEPDMLDILEQYLHDCGARITVAHSARTALAALMLDPPDVLISDISMPGEDGYWLIHAVRALSCEAGGAVPAIAMTGDTVTNFRERVLQAGFDDVRGKPFDLEAFADLVARLVAADSRCRT